MKLMKRMFWSVLALLPMPSVTYASQVVITLDSEEAIRLIDLVNQGSSDGGGVDPQANKLSIKVMRQLFPDLDDEDYEQMILDARERRFEWPSR